MPRFSKLLTDYHTDVVTCGADGIAELVADPGAGFAVWVYGLAITCAADCTVRFQDDATPTPLSGTMSILTGSGMVWPISENKDAPYLKCTASQALDLLTAGVGGTIGGIIIYQIVPQ